MKTTEKIFITIGMVLILFICGGVYINNKVDKLMENSRGLGVFLTEQNAADETSKPNHIADPSNNQESQTGGKTSIPPGNIEPSASDLVFDDSIEAIVQSKLNKPIERKDKIKVALILIKRLSVDDITYFYDLITLGKYTDEDITRVHKILASNLNEEEMETLRSLAKKYGFTP
ncbi:MAG TPA: hypothetical protein PKV15_09900 [Syntrophomonadaceae bacterium]|jgi:hypothetical protein|nr:hypothetical protein [Syntrophomonadaceae bacterium]HRX22097.1 hypothetical protein [Syntrophomonadaceae bacterium]